MADEALGPEAFIVGSRTKSEETKVHQEEEGYEGNFIARIILEVFEDVAVRVEDLLAVRPCMCLHGTVKTSLGLRHVLEPRRRW